VLYRHGCNIVSNSEFVDHSVCHFFMRTEFSGEFETGGIVQELRGTLPDSAVIRLAGEAPRKVVVLATKEPHCLGDLLIRHEFGDLPARIQGVISNQDTLEGLVRRFGIPFHHVSHEGIGREEHEASLLRQITQYAPDYIVLAKYMR